MKQLPSRVWILVGIVVGLLIWGNILYPIAPSRASDKTLIENDSIEYKRFGFDWLLDEGLNEIGSPWLRWDTNWYLRIAKDGYEAHAHSLAFPPLYPMLVRFVGWVLGGQYLFGSLLVSWVAFFGALFLFLDWYNEKAMNVPTNRVFISILSFPTAFFFFAGYSESLFLLLIIASWIFAERSKWHWAGIFGLTAVLTRFLGVIIIVPLLLIFWEQLREARVNWISGIWLGLIPTTFLVWNGITYILFGKTPLLELKSGWGYLEWKWPWEGIIGNIKAISSGLAIKDFFLVLDIFAVIVVLWSIIWWVRQKGYPESVFLLTNLIITLIKITNIGILNSVSRYVLPLFPMYVMIAFYIGRPIVGRVIFYISVTLWFVSVSLFLLGFWIA